MNNDENRDPRAAGAGHAGERSAIHEKPPPEEIEEIEAERRRRLAPENRPENSEVDNMDQIFTEDGRPK